MSSSARGMASSTVSTARATGTQPATLSEAAVSPQAISAAAASAESASRRVERTIACSIESIPRNSTCSRRPGRAPVSR